MSAKVEDLNDLAMQGRLPADLKQHAEPVSAQAKTEAEEAARVVTVRQMLKGACDRAFEKRKPEDRLTTGHWEIDRDVGGFKKGFVWVFGAKSHWGKSSSLVMFADENIKRGKRVLIVSSEDQHSLYGDRLLMRRARVDKYRLEACQLNPEEASRVAAVTQAGEDVPVFLDAIGKSVEWAAKRVKSLVASEGIDLVAWDYLHSFDKEKRIEGDRRAALNYIARTMSDTMKTIGVAGVIYGQVTPDTKAIVPDMYEIRDSKDVVNAADCVAIGFMPSTRMERDVEGTRVAIADAGDRCIVMAKKKTGPGPAGRVYRMGSDKEHGCFDIVPDPADQYTAFADEPMRSPDWEDN